MKTRLPLTPSLLLAGVFPVISTAAPVINEVHYEPPIRCQQTEFIEIHNPDADPVDLTGWRLADAVDFAFPAGTAIPAGGHLVVAQNPAVLQENFGVSALGPWSGTLDNEGEEVELRDAADLKADAVDYRVRFPWPIRPSEGGSSMELIHPALDNDLGSSWRASKAPGVLGELTYFSGAETWSYRKGTSEPPANWNAISFDEDSEWITGQTPIGFGNANQNFNSPQLTDMRGNYSSVYVRKSFTVAPGEIPQGLVLRHNVDDGFIAFINGVEVARVRANGASDFDGVASSIQSPEGAWADLEISAGATAEGENVLAIIVYNQSLTSSDFAFDFGLMRPATPEPDPMPTPGRRNSVYAENAPPNIRQVDHTPLMPAANESTVVTAKVTDPDGVANVRVHYQVVAPGDYLPAFIPHTVSQMLAGGFNREDPRQPNPAYEDPANWTTITMNDEGTGGDAVAGDDIFSATLPPQPHRNLVRYRITVTDIPGAAVRVPYADDPSLNFAYFSYNGVPDYVASTSYPAAMLTKLPVYHLITRNSDMQTARAYNGGDQLPKNSEARRTYNWEGAMVYDGVVYDHINYRLRGANGRYQQAGKRSWKFRFNRGHYFDMKLQDGTPFKRKARVLETAKMFSNRGVGNFGMVDGVNCFLWRLMGLPAPETFWFHWRVIDGAEEAPDQWAGDFWGMALVIERFDIRFLEQHNMERGNLYKLVDGINNFEDQQRYQSCEPGAPQNFEDISRTKSEFNSGKTEQWIRDHANLDLWYRFSAVKEAIRHYDWPSPSDKNMAWYFEPNYAPSNDDRGKLVLLPHDHDDTWGPVWNNGQETIKAAVGNKPEIQKEEKNVVRAFRDLIWQPDQLDTLLHTFALPIVDFTAADRDRWSNAPTIEGRENWGTLEGKIADMKKWAWEGGSWPGGSEGAGGRAAFLDRYVNDSAIPDTPTISYSGLPGFPSNGLSFTSSAYSDPQGAGTFAGMEFRIAEITPVGGGTVSLFPAGLTWRFLDDGSDQGTAWRDPAFDDAAWSEGPAPHGYGGVTGTNVVTQIDFGPDSGNKYVTTYFRRTFDIQNIDAYEKIIIKLHADDGAVVHVNGTEVIRDRFNAGTNILFNTLSPQSGNEGVFDDFEVDASFFVEGENTIAVEVHQQSLSSSDMVFDLSIDAKERLLPAGTTLRMEWNADWESGVLTTFQNTIDVPNSAVGADRTFRARVRHLDDTGRWSHWSSPVQFVTEAPDITEYLNGLVISEFMYNPPEASAAEIAAGYQNQDFEWIEVMNVGAVTLDLSDIRFTKGVDFDFAGSAVTSLAPGEVVLVVKNLAAFEMRYGAGLPVAGEYLTSDKSGLSNGGERLKLSFGGGISIRDFDYGDDSPWPVAADGMGSSLVLVNPESLPDHALAANWAASGVPGGTPGSAGVSANFSDWLAGVFTAAELTNPLISGPNADPDGDGLTNVEEFGLGSVPTSIDSAPYPEVVVDGEFAIYEFRQQTAFGGITYRPEISYDGSTWQSAPPDLIQTGATPNGDGTVTVRVRGANAVDTPAGRRALFRLKLEIP